VLAFGFGQHLRLDTTMGREYAAGDFAAMIDAILKGSGDKP
jgi:hypothetical protein